MNQSAGARESSGMAGRSRVVAALNLSSIVLTAAPLVCAAALVAVLAQVHFVLGSWPLVYGDDAGDWVVMMVGLVSFAAFWVSMVGLVLWLPATGFFAARSERPVFLRRLLVFVAGWALIAVIRTMDPEHLTLFL